jgi:hypothetical protein
MPPLIPGVVISPLTLDGTVAADALVREPVLVLYANEMLDKLVAIPITVRICKRRHYFVGPLTLSHSEITEQLDLTAPRLCTRPFTERPATAWTDEELDKKFTRKGQQESIPLQQLKNRWALISSIVLAEESELLFEPEFFRRAAQERAEDALKDPALSEWLKGTKRKKKVRRGRAFREDHDADVRRAVEEIRRCVNQYWAGGSFRGALIGFGQNCGGPGKSKKAGAAKRGRPNAAVIEGKTELAGINVTEGSDHARIIKFCHDTFVIRGTTESAALRRMWTEFYSEEVQLPNGKVEKRWIAVELRPTLPHFRYWGTKDDARAVAWRKHLPPVKFERSFRAVMGAASDDVFAVGQRGCVDSSPPDLQFVRAIDRLKRVGGGHRILIAEGLVGYLPGLYMGFHAASEVTVSLALYNSMDPDKAGWLEDLSLEELPPEDFIPLSFRNLWADNTDLRSDGMMRRADAVGTNIHFIEKMRSDHNAPAEASHHMLHSSVDHNLSGTTYGRKTERGESPATDRARHSMLEGIREVVRGMHYHNTVELDDNRPLRFRLKNIENARLAILRELMRIGKVARTLQAISLGRRHLLPTYQGTFTLEGVRLHREGSSEKVEFIPHVAWVSTHPLIVSKCEQARRAAKLDPDAFRDTFTVDPYRPRRIWYFDIQHGEPIELTAKVLVRRDPDLLYTLTVPDMEDRAKVEAGEKILLNDAAQRKRGRLEEAHRQSNDAAEAEYADAVQASGGEPSKGEMRRNRRENREAEMGSTMFGIPTILPGDPLANGSNKHPSAQCDTQQPSGSPKADEQASQIAEPTDHQASLPPSDANNTDGTSDSILRSATRKTAGLKDRKNEQ